jgi:hypothetical protein
MTQLLLALVVAILVVGVPATRAVRRACRRSPGSRPWWVAGATALLVGVAVAAPQLDKVIPDRWRESPAGLLPYIGAAVGLGLVAVLAGAIITGVLLPAREPPP